MDADTGDPRNNASDQHTQARLAAFTGVNVAAHHRWQRGLGSGPTVTDRGSSNR